MTDPERLRALLTEEVFHYELNPEWERVVNVEVVDAARQYLRILEADDQVVREIVTIFDKWDYQTGGNRAMLFNDFAKKEMARAVLARLGGNDE